MPLAPAGRTELMGLIGLIGLIRLARLTTRRERERERERKPEPPFPAPPSSNPRALRKNASPGGKWPRRLCEK